MHDDRDPARRRTHHDAVDCAGSRACAVERAAGSRPIGLSYVCSSLFRAARGGVRLLGRGPDADPRRDRGASTGDLALSPSSSPSRPPPSVRCRSARRHCSPRIASPRRSGVDRLWIKDDTRNPSLSFKDRAVAVAAARAVEFGVPALACASTGNLAGATAAAAAAVGLPAYVFIPADLEPAKVDHALAYGATVVPIDGTYDDVNRLCLEVADETGWGFVNINLRPFYAEGSKTLAYEIAEIARLAVARRGGRPGRVGGDVHAGRARVRGARRARPDRGHGRSASSAARRPGAPRGDGLRSGARTSSSPSASPTRSSARSRSAIRPTAATRSSSRSRAAAPSRRSTTRRPPPRSATSPDSRGSTRRRPAA